MTDAKRDVVVVDKWRISDLLGFLVLAGSLFLVLASFFPQFMMQVDADSGIQAGENVPRLNNAWVYDGFNDSVVDRWVQDLSLYNLAADVGHEFQALNVYFGSVSLNPDGTLSFGMAPNAAQRFARYATIPKLKGLYANIDGWFEPGLLDKGVQVSEESLASATNTIARAVCSFPVPLLGIAIDLEPFRAPYTDTIVRFTAKLMKALRNTRLGCGRIRYSVSFFAGPSACRNTALMSALGADGFISISGYDLKDGDVTNPVATHPDEYQAILESVIRNAMSAKCPFALSIPAAGTTQEFTEAVTATGRVVTGYPQYSSTGRPAYINAAFKALQLTKGYAGYKGTTIWAFSDRIVVKGTTLKPNGAFDTPGLRDFLAKNL